MENINKKVVYFFCSNLSKDPVALNVFNQVKEKVSLKSINMQVDNKNVNEFIDESNNLFTFVQTDEVLSHDYEKYLHILKKFNDYDFAGLINWHEGKNAPDKVLTVHSTGDVITGKFGKADPLYTRNLIISIEKNRIKHNLNDFTTTTEATHWSGTPYKQSTDLICEFDVPLVDIEIGSTKSSWENTIAAKIIAESLLDIFTSSEKVVPLLCIGGTHFEETFAKCTFDKNYPMSVTHILANQWVVGYYDDEDAIKKLHDCANSINTDIKAVIFHDNLKSEYKNLAKKLAEELKIPAFKHKRLRKPETLEIF